MSTMHMLGESAQGEQDGAPEEAVAEVFTWTFPGAPVSIQLDAGIISRLAEDAGTGGILLGQTSPDGNIEMTGCEPVNAEAGELPQALAQARQRLAATSGKDAGVVGYYRTQSGGRLALEAVDFQIIDTGFREPDNVFLLIRPVTSAPATAGFFFRDGDQIPEFCFLDFPLSPRALPMARVPRKRAPQTEKRALAAPPPDVPRPAARKPLRWVLWTGGLMAVLALIALALLPQRAARPTAELQRERNGGGRPEPARRRMDLPALAPQNPPEVPLLPAPPRIPASEAGLRNPLPFSLPQGIEAPAKPLVATASSPVAPQVPAAPAAVPPRKPAVSQPPLMSQSPLELHASLIDLPARRLEIPAGNPPVVSEPRPVRQVQPLITSDALRTLSRELEVSVQLHIDASGNVTDATSQSPGGPFGQYFAQRAVAAARLWKFAPATVDTHPVASQQAVTFRFRKPARQ